MAVEDNRCSHVFHLLDSRCILEAGHPGKHCYPNAKFKKQLKGIWKDFRRSKIGWDGEEGTLADRFIKDGYMDFYSF